MKAEEAKITAATERARIVKNFSTATAKRNMAALDDAVAMFETPSVDTLLELNAANKTRLWSVVLPRIPEVVMAYEQMQKGIEFMLNLAVYRDMKHKGEL